MEIKIVFCGVKSQRRIKKMILKNGTVYDDSFEPVKTDIAVEGEKIAKLAPGQAGEGFDLTGMTVIPGMIDMDFHGCGVADAGDATP